MNPEVESLVSSLLHEGYALYPYTPGSSKNSTPTPFGIVYPPAYAEGQPAAFDHLRVECILVADEDAELDATVRFLHGAGERHRAVARRLEVPRTRLGELVADNGVGAEFSFGDELALRGRLRLRAAALADAGLYRVTACVHNTSTLEDGKLADLDRATALGASLLSTQVVIEAIGGRFVSPLESEGAVGAEVQACQNVNTWPVLASAEDDAILAAPIILPDHPKIAPESKVDMFDNTEIEEALLLHVHALSDGEREALETQDPAVREMVERAAATTPEDILALHGRLEMVDPGPPPEPGHPNPGEDELELEGVIFRKGAKVILRPGTQSDVYDRMLDGRTATIERLYLDYEDGAHIAVTVDGSAEQELFRETGRYLFFKAHELEVVAE